MSTAKVSSYRAPDTITEPKSSQLGNEGHESLDNYIIQAIGKEPLLSFARPGESPVQWIQLLHSLEQQGNAKKGLQLDNAVEENVGRQSNHNSLSSFVCESNGIKEPGNIKSPPRETKSSSEHVQTLRIPEAVVAFAQAAAKANGEREKYLPGWPLLSPSKIQLQKCEKCSREFCSPINYRRHIRLHRRSLNVIKVSPKNRELLGAFWDKLSLDETKEIASIKDTSLEEVSGSSVATALASLMRKPGFCSLPQVYLKAGAILLDVVECKSSLFPMSSEELFSVLDDASERTFLCNGMAGSLRKFVFDGEVEKIAMDIKNLIACTSFLLEQKLVEAWLADKDAEALRCQKLLFEEEEAAQKRQAEILEKKRMKKLRQKEQKMKEHALKKCGSVDGLQDAVEGISGSEHVPSVLSPAETEKSLVSTDLLSSKQSSLDDTRSSVMLADVTCCPEKENNAGSHPQLRAQQETAQRPPTIMHLPVPRQVRHGLGSFHSQAAPARPNVVRKHSGYKDSSPSQATGGQMVWTRKNKLESEEERIKCKEQQFENKMATGDAGAGSCKVLIGSISVSLKDCSIPDAEDGASSGQNSVQGRMGTTGTTEATASSAENQLSGESRAGEQEADDIGAAGAVGPPEASHLRALPDGSCTVECSDGDGGSEISRWSDAVVEVTGFSAPKFSSKHAKAFLSQRWREALSSEHVKLVL